MHTESERWQRNDKLIYINPLHFMSPNTNRSCFPAPINTIFYMLRNIY